MVRLFRRNPPCRAQWWAAVVFSVHSQKKPFVQPYQFLGLFILGTFFAMMQRIEKVFAFTRGEADMHKNIGHGLCDWLK